MSGPKPIQIIGGGLAGLTLGIGLRQEGIPVSVWEAGSYPRDRVCGEFVCGRGQAVLERMGLACTLLGAGATHAKTAAFFLGAATSGVRTIEPSALCLSRRVLDYFLAQHFRACGGELLEGSRWTAPEFGECVVRATGRRPRPVDNGWRWFGLKVHAHDVRLAADVEMHAVPDGYVGLCCLSRERINVCGLFRAKAATGERAPQNWQEKLRGPVGSSLRLRLAGATLDSDTFCSLAGLPLGTSRSDSALLVNREECVIGDALTMIAPVTGNGMSMAFEAAELALAPLTAFSHGALTWAEACERTACACHAAFSRRLKWARWLQWMMFTPFFRCRSAAMILRMPWLWRVVFEQTR